MVRLLLLAACLAAAPGIAYSAGEENPPPPPREERPAEGTTSPGAILDTTHSSLERNLLEWVIWFDDFFGNVRTEDSRPPRFFLRWRNSLRWEEEGGALRFRTSARAHLRLPKVSERLQLVIAGESEAEPAPLLPEDPGNPGFDRTLQDTRLVNTELRYYLLERTRTFLFLGAGIRVKFPMEYFARTRFYHTQHFGEAYLARFGETLFWKNEEGFGETTEIDLERKLARKTILRLANAGTVSEESNGLEWGSELALLHAFSPRSAITLGGGLSGRTRPSAVVENYRVFVRVRRNFLRRWLFFELEPEVTWPRSESGSYASSFAATFRLEVLFQGSGLPAYARNTGVLEPPLVSQVFFPK